MSDPDRIRLRHMQDAATEALRFIAGRRKEDLAADRQLALALIKEIEIIGEAANRISLGEESRPDIPWPAIVGMRNRLIHAYADIDLGEVILAISGRRMMLTSQDSCNNGRMIRTLGWLVCVLCGFCAVAPAELLTGFRPSAIRTDYGLASEVQFSTGLVELEPGAL